MCGALRRPAAATAEPGTTDETGQRESCGGPSGLRRGVGERIGVGRPWTDKTGEIWGECPPGGGLRCVRVVIMSDRWVTYGFDEFFVEEFPRLVAMLTVWSGSRVVAEELAQDALLQAQQRWADVAVLDSHAGGCGVWR